MDDPTNINPPQNSLSLNFGHTDAVVVPNGDYIIGHFKADASTQTLTWGGSSAFYSTMDALQVRVPEPSSIVLFGLGAAGLFVAARRRRKA